MVLFYFFITTIGLVGCLIGHVLLMRWVGLVLVSKIILLDLMCLLDLISALCNWEIWDMSLGRKNMKLRIMNIFNTSKI